MKKSKAVFAVSQDRASLSGLQALPIFCFLTWVATIQVCFIIICNSFTCYNFFISQQQVQKRKYLK